MTNSKGNPKPHPAWNKGKKWSEEVKENISRGMVVYWIQKKEHKTKIA